MHDRVFTAGEDTGDDTREIQWLHHALAATIEFYDTVDPRAVARNAWAVIVAGVTVLVAAVASSIVLDNPFLAGFSVFGLLLGMKGSKQLLRFRWTWTHRNQVLSDLRCRIAERTALHDEHQRHLAGHV
ncbi:hypothetical protein ACFVAJ_19370 [Agromyces sp. NPDC057679]|uniref:hypothetical protein n=1 Tax=Agromyces sp. NPDC057679 TaxID=3346207 RepID=UPI003672F3F3